MSARRMIAALLALSIVLGGAGLGRAQDAPTPPLPPPPPAAPPAPADASDAAQSGDVTPARVSYIHGEVSFWRPGAEDWAPARLNTPLAPGDVLYTKQGGNVEIQVGPGAFVRAADGTQIGLDNQDDDFIQLRVTAGHVALDLREVPAGHTIEVDTPNAALTVDRAGFYRVDVGADSTTARAHRGGAATLTASGGAAVPVSAGQQVKVTGLEAPRVDMGPAPELSAWDRWNHQRTDALLQPMSLRYVASGVYGAEALDQHGTWRPTETYGTVWVPAGVPAGWAPYSTGRWIWDTRYAWTWLDDAPWGWAPYHYGRWVYVGSYWAWAPGPRVVRPVYAPALVVFLGGVGVSVGVGGPLGWAPLAWGEPVIPWWGRPGFVGRPWWGGWGGPRVVNNVVVNRNTTINVTNINTYRNVSVTNAVVGMPADRFGHGAVRPMRLSHAEVQRLGPVHGALPARPVAASVMPGTGPATRPPESIRTRPVVATRAPHDAAPALRAQGLEPERASAPAPAPRLVPPPRNVRTRERDVGSPAPSGAAPGGAPGGAPQVVTPQPGPRPGEAARPDGQSRPEPSRRDDRPGRDRERGGRQAMPAPPGPPRVTTPPPTPQVTEPARQTPPAPSAPRVMTPPPGPQQGEVGRPGSPARPEPPRRDERSGRDGDRGARQAAPAQPSSPAAPAAPRAVTAPPPPGPQPGEAARPGGPARPEPSRRDDRPDKDSARGARQAPQPAVQEGRPDPRAERPPAPRPEAPPARIERAPEPRGRDDRPARPEPPARMERPGHADPPARMNRPDPSPGRGESRAPRGQDRDRG